MFKFIVGCIILFGVLATQTVMTPYMVAIAVFTGLFLASGLDEIMIGIFLVMRSIAKPDEDTNEDDKP